MRTFAAALLLVVTGGVAQAQPGQTPAPGPYAPAPSGPYAPAPAPGPYAPAPAPAPGPYAPAPGPYAPGPYAPQPYPPPSGYLPPQPQLQLTHEELQLLQDGEISDEQHIGGGAASLLLGFGSGQAIQGRWSDRGWIFTLGEVGSMVAIFAGLGSCTTGACDEPSDGASLIIAGAIGFTVFRVWEVIDAFAVPPAHNRRVQNLRFRMGYPPGGYPRYSPFVSPARSGDGAVAGLTLRY